MTSVAVRVAISPHFRKIHALGIAVEKSCRELVAGACRVDDRIERQRIDDMDFVTRQNYGALRTACQTGDLTMPSHLLERRIEVVDLIERFDLFFVAEKDIRVVCDQHFEKRGGADQHKTGRTG